MVYKFESLTKRIFKRLERGPERVEGGGWWYARLALTDTLDEDGSFGGEVVDEVGHAQYLCEVLHAVDVRRVGSADAQDARRPALHHGDTIRDIALTGAVGKVRPHSAAVAAGLGAFCNIHMGAFAVRCCSVAIVVQHQVTQGGPSGLVLHGVGCRGHLPVGYVRRN